MSEATRSDEEVKQQEKPAPPDDVEVFDESEEPEKVRVKHKNGRVATYLIGDMGGEGLAKWMKVLGTRVRNDPDGNPIKQDYDGFHADLIHLCLKTEDGSVVPKEMIERFSAKTQNALFEKCQAKNGLSDRQRRKLGKA